jgi:hypothetical protein
MSKYGTIIDPTLADMGMNENTSLQDSVMLSNQINMNKQYDEKVDSNQYVGWEQQVHWNPFLSKLFSKHTVNIIKEKTSEYLIGLDEKGRKIVPTDNVVEAALQGVFNNYAPNTGDIYGKYTVLNDDNRDDYNYVVNQTISLLVRGIRNDLEMQQNNSKLTIWTTLLGDFNEHGLRQHAPIKLKNKRPDPMLFHMKY